MSAAGGDWALSLEMPAAAGFRLWNVEMLNWGTFDGSIVSFPFEGHDAFVTGSVGAGKSTIVDALTTLFVPTARIVYNKAAGAGKNERRLETYLRGVYTTAADDTGTRARPVSLRGSGQVSAVLAHFRDEQAAVDAVFVHVYYFTATGAIEKIYGVSDTPITLEALLAGANSDARTLQRLIRQRVQRCNSWQEYLLAVRRKLGLPHEQALDLWAQTVSMKQVENLTTFVRSHMLEPPDETREKIASLVNHYQDLTASAAAIERAKAQLSILGPLMEALDEHDRHVGASDEFTRVRDEALEAFYSGVEVALIDTEAAATTGRLESAQGRKATLDEQIQSAGDRINVLDKQIDDAGGPALNELERQITKAESSLETRQSRRSLFEERCREAGVQPPADLDEFGVMRQVLQTAVDELARQAEEQKPSYEAIAALQHQREQLRVAEAAIQALRGRKSNLDPDLLALRSRIAVAAGLVEEDLPFVGELLQVRRDRREWEPAVQRLLYGFGTTLLVPEAAYPAVSEWVDSTNLRARLTYQAVPAEARPAGRPVAGTLPDVLEVATSAPMAPWLGGEIVRRFRNIVLAPSVAEFRRAEQAMTTQGQVKRSGMRHEKDDRSPLGDRRRYVLGWDNAAKLEALTTDAASLRIEIEKRVRSLEAAEQQQATLQKSRNAADTLLREYANYADVDVSGAREMLTALTEDRDALLRASSTLTELRSQAGRARDALKKLKERQEKAVGEIATSEVKLAELMSRRAGLPAEELALAEPDMSLLGRLHEVAQQRVASVSLVNIDRVRSAVREDLQGQIDAAAKRAGRARDAAIKAMKQFQERYPPDALDMDATLESAPDFRGVHRRLTEDDLPRFEAEFRRQLAENTLREIAGFNQHLEERRSRIRDRIDRINEALKPISFTRDTYIEVDVAPNSDQELAVFRRDLRECIDGTLGGGEDAYTRARFEQVQAIVERFNGRDNRAEEDRSWTARVTDVRTWHTFAVLEKDRDTGEVVAYYSDSEGKSGGEKEKLAYTVLAAALSYQFGLVPGDPRPKTFRFVALDEAFARGSDVSTRFALELFRAMGFQLLIVTPLQKKEVIAPYVQRVALITCGADHRSRSLFMRIEEYRERMDAARAEAQRDREITVGSR
ncbi:MAG: ATP-binding protein [Sporichthyaceae bacterium]